VRSLGIFLTVAVLGATVAEFAAADVTYAASHPAVQAAGQDSTYGCLICHAEKRRSFTLGVHSERGLKCHDCHGGNPDSFERATAHGGRFLGSPDKFQTIDLCSSCHSDPNQMRQYGIPSDQLAEYRTSMHGRLLLEQRNTDAPTCTDCHDAHTILRPEDARSNVYPTNIPTTCARCHQNVELMAKYSLPTNQFEEYRISAHGVAVFERSNFAAPTCMGCHGSHAALPPGVTEVVNVCERCHVLIGQAFNQGPHWGPSGADARPGCLGCHSNHGTERVAPDSITFVCANCHESGSRAGLMGEELQEDLVRAAESIALADSSIEQLLSTGRKVTDERFRYQTALTNYGQMALALHSLDLDMIDDLSRRVSSNTELVRATAEARAEARWEHKLLLVPVWFLALSAMTFVWFRLRDLRR
jgi:predicted CXXCH cytochrome family protein